MDFLSLFQHAFTNKSIIGQIKDKPKTILDYKTETVPEI